MISNKSRTFISTECIFTNEPWTLPAVSDMSANTAHSTASAGGAKCTLPSKFPRCLSPFLHFGRLLHTWKDSKQSRSGNGRCQNPDEPSCSISLRLLSYQTGMNCVKLFELFPMLGKLSFRTSKSCKRKQTGTNKRSCCSSMSLIDRCKKYLQANVRSAKQDPPFTPQYVPTPHTTDWGFYQTVGFMARHS